MPQSLVQIYLHIVFSTKNRQPFFVNQDILNELHTYLAGICKKMDSPPLAVGGTDDHVHILCRFPKGNSVSDYIKEIKITSSKWIKSKNDDFVTFHWQAGYGAFSISPNHVYSLQKYIEKQQEHHKTESFQDEFRRLLRKYNLVWDEKYVWG